MVTRRRLDAELVRRGLAPSREAARSAIERGVVSVGGRPLPKASTMVAEDEAVTLTEEARRYVSRAGDKLAGGLDALGVEAAGRRCLDAGASTGGFTDVLLDRGAAAVVAVDVGYGQLAWRLREDPRVTVLDRTNARHLTPDVLPFAPDLVVADLSFIPLSTVVPALAAVSSAEADLVLLVKPQFECGPDAVGAGGVVRDPSRWREAIECVARACAGSGAGAIGVAVSRPPGPSGNAEFILHARRGATGVPLDLEAVLDDARSLVGAA